MQDLSGSFILRATPNSAISEFSPARSLWVGCCESPLVLENRGYLTGVPPAPGSSPPSRGHPAVISRGHLSQMCLILPIFPLTSPRLVMAEWAAEYRENPPPTDWGGVYVKTTK